MILSKKVRLYPSEIQEQKLLKSVGIARFIYNWTIERQEENLEHELGKTIHFVYKLEIKKYCPKCRKNIEFKEKK